MVLFTIYNFKFFSSIIVVRSEQNLVTIYVQGLLKPLGHIRFNGCRYQVP
jgi:hypothetical protein